MAGFGDGFANGFSTGHRVGSAVRDAMNTEEYKEKLEKNQLNEEIAGKDWDKERALYKALDGKKAEDVFSKEELANFSKEDLDRYSKFQGNQSRIDYLNDGALGRIGRNLRGVTDAISDGASAIGDFAKKTWENTGGLMLQGERPDGPAPIEDRSTVATDDEIRRGLGLPVSGKGTALGGGNAPSQASEPRYDEDDPEDRKFREEAISDRRRRYDDDDPENRVRPVRGASDAAIQYFRGDLRDSGPTITGNPRSTVTGRTASGEQRSAAIDRGYNTNAGSVGQYNLDANGQMVPAGKGSNDRPYSPDDFYAGYGANVKPSQPSASQAPAAAPKEVNPAKEFYASYGQGTKSSAEEEAAKNRAGAWEIGPNGFQHPSETPAQPQAATAQAPQAQASAPAPQAQAAQGSNDRWVGPSSFNSQPQPAPQAQPQAQAPQAPAPQAQPQAQAPQAVTPSQAGSQPAPAPAPAQPQAVPVGAPAANQYGMSPERFQRQRDDLIAAIQHARNPQEAAAASAGLQQLMVSDGLSKEYRALMDPNADPAAREATIKNLAGYVNTMGLVDGEIVQQGGRLFVRGRDGNVTPFNPNPSQLQQAFAQYAKAKQFFAKSDLVSMGTQMQSLAKDRAQVENNRLTQERLRQADADRKEYRAERLQQRRDEFNAKQAAAQAAAKTAGVGKFGNPQVDPETGVSFQNRQTAQGDVRYTAVKIGNKYEFLPLPQGLTDPKFFGEYVDATLKNGFRVREFGIDTETGTWLAKAQTADGKEVFLDRNGQPVKSAGLAKDEIANPR